MLPSFFISVLLALQGLLPLQSPEDFARSDAATRRLLPSAIPGLSAPVRVSLEQRGCTIPQWANDATPHSAVRGAFTAAGRIEWAVLCSRNKISSILVIQDSTGTVVADLASEPDVHRLQPDGPRGIIFSRQIMVKTPSGLRNLLSHGDRRVLPSSVDHDGIADIYWDQWSVAWYWDGKEWLGIAGSD